MESFINRISETYLCHLAHPWPSHRNSRLRQIHGTISKWSNLCANALKSWLHSSNNFLATRRRQHLNFLIKQIPESFFVFSLMHLFYINSFLILSVLICYNSFTLEILLGYFLILSVSLWVRSSYNYTLI